MKTSYFAKYKLPDGVNIAAKPAPGFDGPSYPALYPKWSFFKKYKEDGDEEAYTKAYNEKVLAHLDPNKVWSDLKNCTLLCWEKSGTFCHRRIVADWLKRTINVDVIEVL